MITGLNFLHWASELVGVNMNTYLAFGIRKKVAYERHMHALTLAAGVWFALNKRLWYSFRLLPAPPSPTDSKNFKLFLNQGRRCDIKANSERLNEDYNCIYIYDICMICASVIKHFWTYLNHVIAVRGYHGYPAFCFVAKFQAVGQGSSERQQPGTKMRSNFRSGTEDGASFSPSVRWMNPLGFPFTNLAQSHAAFSCPAYVFHVFSTYPRSDCRKLQSGQSHAMIFPRSPLATTFTCKTKDSSTLSSRSYDQYSLRLRKSLALSFST